MVCQLTITRRLCIGYMAVCGVKVRVFSHEPAVGLYVPARFCETNPGFQAFAAEFLTAVPRYRRNVPDLPRSWHNAAGTLARWYFASYLGEER
jgi:hypothetical protein